jgi:hypothetical protein
LCSVAAHAVINVIGKVASGAVLDAQTAPSTITIGHNVTADAGSLVALGCQPPSYTGNSAHECAIDPGTLRDHRQGKRHGQQRARLPPERCHRPGQRDVIRWRFRPDPWSIKNNTISGNLTVSGQRATFLGVLFNTVGKNVTLTNIAITDSDPGPGVYVVRNTVGHNLVCSGLTPGVSGGFVPGNVNVVGRNAFGQCAALV